MKIYNADPVTHEYIGESVADPDPLEAGQWLIPAYATTAAPGEREVGKVNRLNGAAWELVEDHRGAVYSTDTGLRSDWNSLGALPEGLTHIAPPDEFSTWIDGKWAPNDDLKNKHYADAAVIKRSALLGGSDWYVLRHKDELELGDTQSLTDKQYSALLKYRKALRDITSAKGYPCSFAWPKIPDGIEIEV